MYNDFSLKNANFSTLGRERKTEEYECLQEYYGYNIYTSTGLITTQILLHTLYLIQYSFDDFRTLIF